MKSVRFAGLGLLLASSAFAQQQFLPLGTQIMDGSQNMVTVNLGFNFTMPGGAVVSSVDVDECGRIVQVGTDPSDSSESTTEMINNPTGSINVMWDFATISAANNAGIYFDTDNSSVATVTWTNFVFIGAPCTFQVQLFASGEIVMLYNSDCPADDGITGVCPGNGAILPPQTNLDDAINIAPIVTADPTVFEDFGFTAGVDAFDFPSSYLQFIPSGAGGVNGWTVIGGAGVTDPILPFAENEAFGGGCFQKASYTYIPDGLGGYTVTKGPSAFDPNIGVLAGATADDTITAIGLDLTFPMLFPDGTTHQLVDIDPNGRILPTTAAGTAGDLSPSILDITTDGYPYFFGLWSDWNVSESTSDGIYFNTVPGASATFTWNNVAQFGTDPIPPCTWQVTLFNGGVVIITHEDLSGFNIGNNGLVSSSADDVAVGMTSGALPDPGEIDHTALPAVTASYPYEFWDSSGTAPVEPFTLTISTPTLVAQTRPIQGASWDLQATNVDASSFFGIYILGLTSTSLDLSLFGSPCFQSVTGDLLIPQLADGLGNIIPYSLALPATPSLTGQNIYLQCAVQVPVGGAFGNFLGTGFGLTFTNAVKGTIGDL